MLNTKGYLKNIIPISAAVLSLTTAVVLLQKDAMINLGLCSTGDTLCIILANIGVIASLSASIVFVLFLIIALPDVIVLLFNHLRSKFKNYVQIPNFKNVKVHFVGNETSDISIQVHNKEWRYPTVSVEVLCSGNLKWKLSEESDIAKIKRFRKAEVCFIKAKKGKLYLETRRNPSELLASCENRLEIVMYITIGKARVSRPFFVEVKNEVKNKISITNITQLQDIVQEPGGFSMTEL